MKCLLNLLACISFPLLLFGQIENQKNWQIGYYGDVVIHPGLKIGYEMPLKNWTTSKDKKKGVVNKYKSWNVGLEAMYYKHPQHHLGFIFSPNLSYRRTKENGKFTQIKLNMGYHKSWVDGITYTVNNMNEVAKENKAGQSTFYNSLSFGFGKDLRKKKNVPIRYYWELGLNSRTPYNKSVLLGMHLGFGIHYFLK